MRHLAVKGMSHFLRKEYFIMYDIIISVGLFEDNYQYRLKSSRFFWMAKIKAKIELYIHPFRKALIKKDKERKVS